MTLRDRLVEARRYVQDMHDVVSHFKKPGEQIVVKYRTENQRRNFPCDYESRVGYGTLLDLCTEQTVVIGPPGSALLECLSNGVRFYSFWDYDSYIRNRYLSIQSLNRLSEVVYIAKSKEELLDNLHYQRIYKPGRSKTDLLHQDGMRLKEIVSKIIGER